MSHPADTVVSKLNNDVGSTPIQAARDLGMKGKSTIFRIRLIERTQRLDVDKWHMMIYMYRLQITVMSSLHSKTNEAEQDMKNSADLGGCHPPRPSALVDNILFNLQNSSYPTQPHSIIAKYY